jgi:RHS repeat-associated protein
MVTDSSGTVVYSEAYNPYGGVLKTWENSFDPLPKFSVKERDKESGLDYFGARYYDKEQYRFISVDPIINPRGSSSNSQLFNLYTYCRNNPISFLDTQGYASVHCRIGRIEVVHKGDRDVGVRGWGFTDPNYTIEIGDSRASLDVNITFTAIVLGPDTMWAFAIINDLAPNSQERTLAHERRHVRDIKKYVKKRISELEPEWVSGEYSVNEIEAKIRELVNEGVMKTVKKWDFIESIGWWIDKAERWFYGFDPYFYSMYLDYGIYEIHDDR